MKNLYAVLTLFISAFSFSQHSLPCGTDVIMKKMYDKNPALKLKKQQMDRDVQSGRLRASTGGSYVIPVVFHILHLGGPENISDEQVRDGLRVLNRDFAKRNADTVDIIPVFKNIADSAGIRFVLATRDPSGNCTSGIIHHYDPDTDWSDTSGTIFSHTWDPTRYMNVYLVRTITMSNGFGAAGYTFFPGTFSAGDPWDAIVVLNNYFATTGTGNSFLSRVLTHEVGHWLDLYHVFGGSNGAGIDCTGDDFVNDTPTSIGYLNCPNPSIPSQYQTCTPGISENFQNYMDYSYCCRMFTQGQAARMQAALQNNMVARDNLWTSANLILTGVSNPTAPCVPVADFKYNRGKACAGTPVLFKDASWNGQPASYSWSFPGGNPSSSTASAPVISYASPGVYSVTYSVSNSAGTSTPVTKTNIITVVPNTATYNNGWSEGFESGIIPNNDWTLESFSGAVDWRSTALAAYDGIASAGLLKENNTRKTITSMIGPMVSLTGMMNPMLSFKVAAGESNPAHVNKLVVYASTDCGGTWSPVYTRSGAALVTSPSASSNFIPAGKSEWRTELVSLAAYAQAPRINFKFTYMRDTLPGANNIFIDNINIGDGTSIAEADPQGFLSYQVYPNPASGQVEVSYYLQSAKRTRLLLAALQGKTVLLNREMNGVDGENKTTLNITGIEAGIYILQLEVDGMRFGKKLVIY